MLRLTTQLTICSLLLVTAGFATAETLLPAYVLQLPESVHDVFIADTGSSTIYRFERSSSGLGPGQESYMSFGQRGVGKERSGDRRTPLGIYFVVDQLDTSRLHEKYGVTAFPLDYPNAWDRQQQRTGDGIWVHGVVPGGQRRPPQDTDGCIALPNEDLAALVTKFVPLVTPVIITRKMRWANAQTIDRLRGELLAAVNAWAEHYGNADLHAYLSMYADDFSYRGMSLGEWASFRLQTIEQRGVVDVSVDELLLLADPEEEGLYIARFFETLQGPELSSNTTKRLYWRRNEDGEWRIVAEDNG
jgi:murein L,D-transpeptidase YafK